METVRANPNSAENFVGHKHLFEAVLRRSEASAAQEICPEA